MKKTMFLGLALSLLVVSCKKEKNEESKEAGQDSLSSQVADSSAIVVDSSATIVDSSAIAPVVEEPKVAPIEISVIPKSQIPYDMEGCGCGYAKNKQQSSNYNNIYLDNTGDVVMYLDGTLQRFSIGGNPNNLNNGAYKVVIKTQKVGDLEEGAILKGSMTITRLSDGATETTSIYGVCGC